MNETTFSELEQKVEQLVIRFNQLRDNNEELQQTVRLLESENAQLEQHNAMMEGKVANLIDLLGKNVVLDNDKDFLLDNKRRTTPSVQTPEPVSTGSEEPITSQIKLDAWEEEELNAELESIQTDDEMNKQAQNKASNSAGKGVGEQTPLPDQFYIQ